MSETKTGVNLSPFGYGGQIPEILETIAAAGFDAFFTGDVTRENGELIASEAAKRGLRWDSIHAPFRGMNSVWSEAGNEEGERWVPTLNAVADKCRDFGVGYYTVHCQNVPRFNDPRSGLKNWSLTGAERFLRAAEYAAAAGVRASFENVEFPELELRELLGYLRPRCPEGIGFTWDIGHEHCYPAACAVTELYGDLLIGTHIHDNRGNTDPSVITWDDDLHVLPFDGTVDFSMVARELRRLDFDGVWMLELKRAGQLPSYGTDYPDLYSWLTEANRRVRRAASVLE